MKERFETFTVLIAKIGRSIKKIKNQEMAEYGLRSPHISRNGGWLFFRQGKTNARAACICAQNKFNRRFSRVYNKGELVLVYLRDAVYLTAAKEGV